MFMETMSQKELPEATILIVDDDPTNLSVLLEYLDAMHFNVLVACDGDSALEQIAYRLPDLILLDVLMPPGIDGFETCRRLKNDPQTQNIPVIFMTALSDAESKVQGFQVGGIDYITKPLEEREVFARVNAHLTIRQQQRQLQVLNASKDRFFSIIAHDLRSPLSSLRLLTELAYDNLENSNIEKLKEVINLQQSSVDKLCKLLENLLTWSRMQQGLIEYHPQQVDLRKIVAQNLALLNSNAQQKQITLQSVLTEQTEVYADLEMIHTVIRNLISNALKFTKTGGKIVISATPLEAEVEIAVADTGIGIPPESLSKIFQLGAKFKQLGTARESGTGLGLILCQEFIAKHDGRFWVESEVGKGSTFRFTLPQKHSALSDRA
jgi:two-component system, sensor histidine kinase and response regulator